MSVVSENTVFLLGAGVSVHAGYPLVKNFNQELLRHQPQGNDEFVQFVRMAQHAIRLFPNRNIEELVRLASNPGDPDYKQIQDMVMTGMDGDKIGQQYVINPIKFAIVEYMHSLSISRETTDAVIAFANKVKAPIITFNWDTLIDTPLMRDQSRDWLGPAMAAPASSDYLKLHGSSDCLYCLNCKSVFRIDVANLASAFMHKQDRCPYCGGEESHGIEDVSYACEPLLIGFSIDKKQELARIPMLQLQWNRARELLIHCDHLRIVGFSLSPIDRHVLLFLDGILRMRKKNWLITIVNPDNSSEFKANVMSCFGAHVSKFGPGNSVTFDRYENAVEVQLQRLDFLEFVQSL